MWLFCFGQFCGIECTRVWHFWARGAVKCCEQSLRGCFSGSLQDKDVERNVDGGDYLIKFQGATGCLPEIGTICVMF